MLIALLPYWTRVKARCVQWSVCPCRHFSIIVLSLHLLLLRPVRILVVVHILLAIWHLERLISKFVARASWAVYRICERRHTSLWLIELITAWHLTISICVIHSRGLIRMRGKWRLATGILGQSHRLIRKSLVTIGW